MSYLEAKMKIISCLTQNSRGLTNVVISSKTGINLSSVKVYLAQLDEMNCLTKVKTKKRGHKGRPTTLYLTRCKL